MKTREQKLEYQRIFQREWVKKNPEKVRASKRRYYATHGDKIHADRRRYRAENGEKLKALKLAWEKANPELVSMMGVRRRIKKMNAKINGDLKYHYDITLNRYNELLAQQNGVCAICEKLEVTKRTHRLVVDHAHATGRIRGLLCHRCNCGIGYFKDDPKHIQKALDYLGQWADE